MFKGKKKRATNLSSLPGTALILLVQQVQRLAIKRQIVVVDGGGRLPRGLVLPLLDGGMGRVALRRGRALRVLRVLGVLGVVGCVLVGLRCHFR